MYVLRVFFGGGVAGGSVKKLTNNAPTVLNSKCENLKCYMHLMAVYLLNRVRIFQHPLVGLCNIYGFV